MRLSKDKKTLQEIASLVEYSFLKNNDITKDVNFLARYNHSTGYGEFHDNKLMSYVMCNHFESCIFNKNVKMAGIGYVASFPENRGHGDISRIMDEILQDCHQNNIALSNLAPWSETFYRQYGYENSIYQKILTIDPLMLRFFKPRKDCKIIRDKWENNEIQKLVFQLYNHEINSNQEQNTVIRNQWWWNRFTTYYPGRFVAVSTDINGKPQAYLFYRIIDNVFYAEEFYFENVNGALNLLAFIGSHLSSCRIFKITMPYESHLEDLFPDQEGINVTIRPYMMSRIIDFSTIASCLKLTSHEEVNIEVTNDQQCPWNNGVWHLSPNNQTTVKKTSLNPDYSASIINWTKIIVGRLTVKQATELGLLKKFSSRDLQIEKGKVSFYDYF